MLMVDEAPPLMSTFQSAQKPKDSAPKVFDGVGDKVCGVWDDDMGGAVLVWTTLLRVGRHGGAGGAERDR